MTGAISSAAELGDPAGAYSLAGASAATLAAPGASIPVTGATAAAAQIVSPPGTYLPPGASAPIADPGGTYSAAGASAPTTDPAGTYSSPYALNRLFILGDKHNPRHRRSVVSQRNGGGELLWRHEYRSLPGEGILWPPTMPALATMLFTRFGLGQRPHLLGANISNLTLVQV